MHEGRPTVGRRRFIGTTAAIAISGPALAGCSSSSDSDGGNGDGNDEGDGGGGGGGETTEVAVGPGGDFTFEPAEVTVSTGDTVVWSFESAGHNVECKPSEADEATLPDGAKPFASYDGSDRFGTNDQGTTFEYTFSVAGTYDYVCVPHIGMDMLGTVVVE